MNFGFNLEGLEWIPAQPPLASAIQYYMDSGFYLFRLPIAWEALQPTLYGPMDSGLLASIDSVVSQVTAKPGAVVILDLHNYMCRGGEIVGESAEVFAGHLADAWGKLAARYGGNSSVWYGLMNEPHDCDMGTLAATLNGCIGAIQAMRAAGNIVVPGGDWSNGQRWLMSGNDRLVAQIVTTPGLIFEVHQYLDTWGAGKSPTAVTGSGRWLNDVTSWAQQWGCNLLLGETACGHDAASMAEMGAMISGMKSAGCWVGLCWWSSLGGHPDPNGRWYNLDPVGGTDRPQMALLK